MELIQDDELITENDAYTDEYYQQYVLIKRVSEQLEGVTEDLTNTSGNVKKSAEFIADGNSQQIIDAENCIKLTDSFTVNIDSMDHKSMGLITLANDMAEVNKHGKNSIVNLSEKESKNKKATEDLSDRIHSLLEKTKTINEVTNILRAIFEETTLLSYNAKIEATHAGIYGKGFTVIANEIRKLSEESSTASENINGIIESITDELSALRTTLDTSIEVFADQSKSVEDVIDDFERINQFTETFIEEQKKFRGQVDEIKVQKDDLVDSMLSIFSGIQESAATTEELATLTISQYSSTAILEKMSLDLADQVNIIGNKLDKEKVASLTKAKKKVSVIFDVEGSFFDPTIRETIKAAKAFNVDVDFFAPSSYGTGIAEMEKKLSELISAKYDALIISPVEGKVIEERLQELNSIGTKIIFINSKLDGVKYESLVETNGILAGKAAAKVAKKALNNQGEVIAAVWSDIQITSIENRAKGFIEELRTNSNIIVHEFNVLSLPTNEQSERSIAEMLRQYPNARLVFATNLTWGNCFSKYIKKYNPNVKVITMDFTKDIRTAILNGTIDSAIAQRAFSWGSISLGFLDKVFRGKPVDKYVDTGTYEVNLSNVNIYEGRV